MGREPARRRLCGEFVSSARALPRHAIEPSRINGGSRRDDSARTPPWPILTRSPKTGAVLPHGSLIPNHAAAVRTSSTRRGATRPRSRPPWPTRSRARREGAPARAPRPRLPTTLAMQAVRASPIIPRRRPPPVRRSSLLCNKAPTIAAIMPMLRC